MRSPVMLALLPACLLATRHLFGREFPPIHAPVDDFYLRQRSCPCLQWAPRWHTGPGCSFPSRGGAGRARRWPWPADCCWWHRCRRRCVRWAVAVTLGRDRRRCRLREPPLSGPWRAGLSQTAFRLSLLHQTGIKLPAVAMAPLALASAWETASRAVLSIGLCTA